MITKKIMGVVAGGMVLLVGLIKTWPLVLEPNLSGSLRVYSKYIMGEQAEVSDLLGPVDFSCAVGPFDSYRDARFSQLLTEGQIVAAEGIFKEQNRNRLGDTQFFLVGFRSEKVVAIYASNFFSNFKSLDKKSSVPNCVGGNGLIFPEKFNSVIAIKLQERK